MHRTLTGLGLFALALLHAGCGTVSGTAGSHAQSVEADLRAAQEAWHGTPYAPGGSDLTGIDQISFVRRLYEDLFAIDLPRTPSRMAEAGQEVQRNDLRAGDLVLFRLAAGPSHVGIYLGRNEFAHVDIDSGVAIGRMDDAAWSDAFLTARRLNLPGQPSRQEPAPKGRPGGGQRTGW